MTPRQFALLLDRHDLHQRMADRRAGEVVAILYNVNVDRKQNPRGITWLDVFPQHKEPVPVQTDDQLFDAMMMWVKATRGGGLST